MELDICLSSPKVRASGTAELACAELGVEVARRPRWRAATSTRWRLAAGRGEVMLVGREPDFSRAVAFVTGSRVKMRRVASPRSTIISFTLLRLRREGPEADRVAHATRRAEREPSASYSRNRKPSNRRRWPSSSRRMAITMSWVTWSRRR